MRSKPPSSSAATKSARVCTVTISKSMPPSVMFVQWSSVSTELVSRLRTRSGFDILAPESTGWCKPVNAATSLYPTGVDHTPARSAHLSWRLRRRRGNLPAPRRASWYRDRSFSLSLSPLETRKYFHQDLVQLPGGLHPLEPFRTVYFKPLLIQTHAAFVDLADPATITVYQKWSTALPRGLRYKEPDVRRSTATTAASMKR